MTIITKDKLVVEMANVMEEDADAHVTARRIEIFTQVLFGPREGHKWLFPRQTPSWVDEVMAREFADFAPLSNPSSAGK